MTNKKQSSEFSQKDLDIFVSILKGESFKRTGENYNISSDEVKKTIDRLYLHCWKRGYFKPVEKHTNEINIIELRKDPDYYISVVTDMIEGKELPGGTASKKRITKVISTYDNLPEDGVSWLIHDPPDEDSNDAVSAAREVLDGWKEEKVRKIAKIASEFLSIERGSEIITHPKDTIDQLINWFESLEYIYIDISDPLSDPVFDGININIRELTSVLILKEAFKDNSSAAIKGAMILADLIHEELKTIKKQPSERGKRGGSKGKVDKALQEFIDLLYKHAIKNHTSPTLRQILEPLKNYTSESPADMSYYAGDLANKFDDVFIADKWLCWKDRKGEDAKIRIKNLDSYLKRSK